MARCDCPFQFDSDQKRKHSSSREVVLRHLRSTDKKRKKRKFKAFLQECRFDLVRNAFLEYGAIDVDYKDSWIIAWTDGSISIQSLTRMKPYQKINHFPGMSDICKKNLLAINLKKMKKIFPKEYNFFPPTFCLPDEFRLLSNFCQKRKKKDIFIIKPYLTCQGSGIDLVKGIDYIKRCRNVVCQKYITMPLLMDSFKLDLRTYVLVTSVNPLRIYVYKEGLVRLATVPYKKPNSSNMHERRMHLTNYAINRNARDDCSQKGSQQTCKRSFSELEEYLNSLNIKHDHLWPAIDDIIVKTILSVLPNLKHLFQTSFPMQTAMSPCFEVLGFDVLLNRKAKPYLLEVNRSPSFGGSSTMDRHLKKGLIKNTIDMVLSTPKQISLLKDEQHLKAVRRLTNPNTSKHLTAKERIVAEYQEKREAKKMGNFRQIYPVTDGRYDPILRYLFSSRNDAGSAEAGEASLEPREDRCITPHSSDDSD